MARKAGGSLPNEKPLYFKTREWLYKNPKLKQNEEKVCLFNVLPPCLDLLVPPPAEAPQLAPI